MSEPVTLYRDGDEVVITAPSEVRRMLADGWSRTNDYVPFAFSDEFDAVIANPPFVTADADALTPVDQMNVAPAKRGRPRKAQM